MNNHVPEPHTRPASERLKGAGPNAGQEEAHRRGCQGLWMRVLMCLEPLEKMKQRASPGRMRTEADAL